MFYRSIDIYDEYFLSLFMFDMQLRPLQELLWFTADLEVPEKRSTAKTVQRILFMWDRHLVENISTAADLFWFLHILYVVVAEQRKYVAHNHVYLHLCSDSHHFAEDKLHTLFWCYRYFDPVDEGWEPDLQSKLHVGNEKLLPGFTKDVQQHVCLLFMYLLEFSF